VRRQLDELPERIALACPTGWGAGRLRLVHEALAQADLAGATLVTRARAVVECHQAAGRVAASGGTLLVYRIGSSSVEVAVVAPHGPGRMELLGSAELDEISGYELDDAGPDEARSVLRSTVDLAQHTVRSCGDASADLSAVLIAGGSRAVHPIVSDLLTAAFDVPVLLDHDPRMTVAAGAALAVRPQPSHVPPRADPPAPPVVPAAAVDGPSWPEAGGARMVADRPPRPPVRVGAVRTADR
jgi:hypothetical protein